VNVLQNWPRIVDIRAIASHFVQFLGIRPAEIILILRLRPSSMRTRQRRGFQIHSSWMGNSIAQMDRGKFTGAYCLTSSLLSHPRTETPANDSMANPRTGWPKKRAGAKRLNSSTFSTWDRVVASLGPETMR